jgi:hypothetical protein
MNSPHRYERTDITAGKTNEKRFVACMHGLFRSCVGALCKAYYPISYFLLLTTHA